MNEYVFFILAFCSFRLCSLKVPTGVTGAALDCWNVAFMGGGLGHLHVLSIVSGLGKVDKVDSVMWRGAR